MYSFTIEIGKTQLLYATIIPLDVIADKVTWSSNNKAIATVDNTGLVTGVSAGKATITATTLDGSLTGASEITVTDGNTIAPPHIKLNKTKANVRVGKTEQLVATVTPEDRPLTWSSSNAAIATVDDSGLVTGISVGMATVVAKT